MRRSATVTILVMLVTMILAPVALAAIVRGTNGDDQLRGTRARDIIRGYDGADNIISRPGGDDVYGHRGEDYIWGGVGNDDLRGGRGNDYVEDPIGWDHINGRAGNDTIIDVQFRGAQVDRIVCGPGRDDVYMDRQDKAAKDCESVHRNAIP